MDRFAPVAPACIRVLVLPIGRVTKTCFHNVLDKLQRSASIIELTDLPKTEQHLLVPQETSQGSLLFNYITSPPSQQEHQLSPFELFREPLLVLGVTNRLKCEGGDRQEELVEAARYLRERHPWVVHRHILLQADGAQGMASNSVTVISKSDDNDGPVLRAAMCEIAARFLVELTTYTKALQVSPTVQTPGQTSKGLKRTSSTRVLEHRPASGYATPPPNSSVSSPVGDDSSRPPSRGIGSLPPATSFDQMQGANNVPSALTRSDSRTGTPSGQNSKRASSQDRVTAHGFGPTTSKERDKNRGKARVGIVIGHIHLMAGQWAEGLRTLVEHTTVSRKLADNLWHAKGLEGILVSMLLLAWAGIAFSIPSICYATVERSSSAHAAKLSVNLLGDFRPAEVAYQAAVGRLSTSLPDLLKHILSLYRSGEGTHELPPLALCEGRIRFCALLATLHHENGELNGSARTQIVERSKAPLAAKPSSFTASSASPRSSVATMLAEAQPTDDDHLLIVDHVPILAGMASVYSSLGMERKKGLVLKEMVEKLTAAIIQAQKVGAAEAGIHPAAILSADRGADSIVEIGAESRGVEEMIFQIADIYGVTLHPTTPIEDSHCHLVMATASSLAFGSDLLKTAVTQTLVNFCEASPDPEGVLRTATYLLRSATALTTLDSKLDIQPSVVSKADQIRLAATVSRTVAVSKRLGLPDVQASYWDRFLVRHIDFIASAYSHSLVPHPESGLKGKPAETETTGNPLLYDPNASRPDKTAPDRLLMVHGEPFECRIILQNPLEIAVDIEDMTVWVASEGSVELETHDFVPTTLDPLCFRQVSLSVSPNGVGDFSILGCRVKIAGCHADVFPVFKLPWAASPDLLVKHHGREARTDFNPGPLAQGMRLSATAISSMPVLRFERTSVIPDLTMMLLDGERTEVSVTVRNTSHVPAAIFDVSELQCVMRLRRGCAAVCERRPDDEDATECERHSRFYSYCATLPAVVQPGMYATMFFDVIGRLDTTSHVLLDVLYGPSPLREQDKFARVLPVVMHFSVEATLQVQVVGVEDDGIHENGFVLTFDLRNVSAKPLSYSIESSKELSVQVGEDATGSRNKDVLLGAGEVRRVVERFKRGKVYHGDEPMADVRSSFMQRLNRRIRIPWQTCLGGARWGEVDLRHLTFTEEHLKVVRGPTGWMRLNLVESHVALKVGSFVTIRVTLNFGAPHPKVLLVKPQSLQLNFEVVGAPSRLVVLSAAGEAHVDFGVCLMTPGVLKLIATAEVPERPGRRMARTGWCTENQLCLRVV
ncbi:hypothetical protein LTR08_007791 [Meristemomyces frigidus]|nr:hypothetical protein LTR08_007791 [Meristemomyces frigidus]